jgi:hypothetical protein
MPLHLRLATSRISVSLIDSIWLAQTSVAVINIAAVLDFIFSFNMLRQIFWLRGPRSYGRQSYIGRPALPVSYPLVLSDLPADLGVAIYNFRPGGGKMPTSRILDLWIPN